MICNVSVGDKIVVLDGVARWCLNLAPPEPWARAYTWDPLVRGMIHPYPQSQVQPVYFDNEDRMQWAVEAWNASVPPAPKSLDVTPPEPEPSPTPPAPDPIDPPPPPEIIPPIDP